MDPTKDIAKLGKYGVIGVMLALVMALMVSQYLIYSLSAKYIADGNMVNRELTNAVTELSTIIKLPNRITKQ